MVKNMGTIAQQKKVVRKLVERLHRNPTRANEGMYDSFMSNLTATERKKVLSDATVKKHIKAINRLGGLK